MTLATLSACLPLPYPDASAETLRHLLSCSSSSSSLPRGVSRDPRGESLTPLYCTASSEQRVEMVSLGPVARRRKRLSGLGSMKGQAATSAGVGAEARVFSRKMVWRGFTAPRDRQLDALEQVRPVLRCSLCYRTLTLEWYSFFGGACVFGHWFVRCGRFSIFTAPIGLEGACTIRNERV